MRVAVYETNPPPEVTRVLLEYFEMGPRWSGIVSDETQETGRGV
jgi:hypothetical protein